MLEAWRLMDRVLSALDEHDVDRALRCYDTDAVYVSPMGVMEGPEEIAGYFEHFLKGFPDARRIVWHRIAFAEPVFAEYTLTGTHGGPFPVPDDGVIDGTGRRIAVRCCTVCTAVDGHIVTHREYFDRLELFAQLGLSIAADG